MVQRSQTIHYLIRAVILGGFSYLIVKLVQDERLHYYIAPRTEGYVKLAALGLFAIGLFQVYMALQVREKKQFDCGCDHTPAPSLLKNILSYSLFVLPLLFGFFTQDTLLGSGITSLKGINLTSSTTINQPLTVSDNLTINNAVPPISDDQASAIAITEEKEYTATPDVEEHLDAVSEETEAETTVDLNLLFPSDKYTEDYAKLGMLLFQQEQIAVSELGFIEIITTMDLYRDAFVGKRLEMSGYVYREDDMKQEQFVVSRLAMGCCSADMEPYGLLASSPQAKELHDDAWVTVIATVALTDYNGMEIMELQVESFELITPPDTPYVYPDYGYIELLIEELQTK